jgi:hypothetical protein
MIGNQRVEVVARQEPPLNLPAAVYWRGASPLAKGETLTPSPLVREGVLAVVYDCNTDRGPATLRIDLVDQGRATAVYWQVAEAIYQLSPADIQVYA